MNKQELVFPPRFDESLKHSIARPETRFQMQKCYEITNFKDVSLNWMYYIFSESKVFKNMPNLVIQKRLSFPPARYYLSFVNRFSQAIFIALHIIKKCFYFSI